MTLVKVHTCSKCGGALEVNNELQRYECPFCGISYDYAYFQKKVVLEMADSSLHAEDFPFAEKRYLFALKKEPHDPRLLQGRILSRAKFSNVEKTLSIPDLVGVDYPSVERALNTAEKNAFPEDKEYFETLHSAFRTAEELEEIRKEKSGIESEIKVDHDAIEIAECNGVFRSILDSIGDTIHYFFFGGLGCEEHMFRIFAFIYLFGVIFGAYLLELYNDDSLQSAFIYVLIILLIPAIAVLILNVVLSRRELRHRKMNMKENKSKLEKIITEEITKVKELSEIIDRLEDMDLSKSEEEPASDVRSYEENLKEIVTCPSCDGELIDNRSRALFECPYCGLTFDYEYVRHDRVLDQAEKALLNELYHEAELYFAHAEETRPRDFRVLRGYALCAVKAPKTLALKLEGDQTKEELNAMRESIASLLEKVPSEEKEYFEKLQEIVEIYDEQRLLRVKIEAPLEKVSALRVKKYSFERVPDTPKPRGEKTWKYNYPKKPQKLSHERWEIEHANEQIRAMKTRVLEIRNSMIEIEKAHGLPEDLYISI